MALNVFSLKMKFGNIVVCSKTKYKETVLNYCKVTTVYYSVGDTGILGKKNLSAPVRSRTQDLPITSLDALPLSYRRLVGAKAI